MIYKKIENYFGELTNDKDCPLLFGIVLLIIILIPILAAIIEHIEHTYVHKTN
jgi:hypothetical protein